MLLNPTLERETFWEDDIHFMENTEADSKGSGLAPHNQPTYLELHDVTRSKDEQDAFLVQEGSLQEGCMAIQTERCSDLLVSRQLCALSNSSGIEADVKEIPLSINAGPTMLSRLYCSEGAVKDFGAFAALNNSAGFSGPLGSHVNEIRTSGFNAAICHRQRPWLFQKPQNYQVKNTETPKEASSQAPIRVARPPGEGRGKNQLLPRYWPRITDQELQLLTSKDSNSTITPLFEKVLSASDAGRIGRLVLPKACAEAYFPPISQAEGLPLIVQDVSGKEWVFQFRFWPNNNSRMYVLEGITPCIQSMHLQAGDTVIFSRLDPEGKLVLGYRRAPNTSSAEAETQKPTMAGSTSSLISSSNTDKFSTVSSLTGLLSQSVKSSSKAQVNRNSGQFNMQVGGTGYGLHKTGMSGSKTRESSPFDFLLMSDKRKAKEISLKNKRLRFDAESVKFKMNWEEAQSLLRSPPNVVPSIVTIEGYDFEEYEEPPVFGKGAILNTSPAGNFCNTQQDVENDKSDSLLQHMKAVKKQEVVEPVKATEPLSGLEALANLATVEENNNAASASSPATTTKHPRHRPGCSCIVCIQPPSGKGPKHEPNCNCNVCMTVKRRFHTLMLRRKKLQSEREAENAIQKKQPLAKEGVETNTGGRRPNESGLPKSGSWQGGMVQPFSGALPRVTECFSNGNGTPFVLSSTGCYAPRVVKSEYDHHLASKGPQIDLNSQPEREEEMNRGALAFSMKSLLQSASYPLDIYLKQQGLTSLVCNEQLQVPTESFATNVVGKKGEEHGDNQSAVILSSDGFEEEPYMSSVMENIDQATD